MATTSPEINEKFNSHTEQDVTIRLFDLPSELLNRIIFYLRYPDLVNLRQTSKASVANIPASTVTNARKAFIRFLFDLENEEWTRRQMQFIRCLSYQVLNQFQTYPGPQSISTNAYMTSLTSMTPMRTYFSPNSVNNIHTNEIQRPYDLTCYSCFRSLPVGAFATTQRTGRRSLGHTDAIKRFCVDCGIKKRIWSPGVMVKGVSVWDGPYMDRNRKIGGVRQDRSYIVCANCRGAELTSPASRAHKLCLYCYYGTDDKGGDTVGSSKRAHASSIGAEIVPKQLKIDHTKLDGDEIKFELSYRETAKDMSIKPGHKTHTSYQPSPTSAPLPLSVPTSGTSIMKSPSLTPQSVHSETMLNRPSSPPHSPSAKHHDLTKQSSIPTQPKPTPPDPTTPLISPSSIQTSSTQTPSSLTLNSSSQYALPKPTRPGRRHHRCQRCWAQDHTERAVVEVVHNQGYCITCLRTISGRSGNWLKFSGRG